MAEQAAVMLLDRGAREAGGRRDVGTAGHGESMLVAAMRKWAADSSEESEDDLEHDSDVDEDWDASSCGSCTGPSETVDCSLGSLAGLALGSLEADDAYKSVCEVGDGEALRSLTLTRQVGQLSLSPSRNSSCAKWQAVDVGPAGTLRARMLIVDHLGRQVSPWHCVPLQAADSGLNFVCQTPRGTWARWEVAVDEQHTPLRIAARAGKPAHFAENVQWNYGSLPQTYGDPSLRNDSYGGFQYGGKPMEAVEIGTRAACVGEIYSVKPLGLFAVIEDGKLQWKVVTIALQDLMADICHDIRDLERIMPGTVDEIREWLRTGKCLDVHDEENLFGLNERAGDQRYAQDVIQQTHSSWLELMAGSPHLLSWLPRLKRIPLSSHKQEWPVMKGDELLSRITASDELDTPTGAARHRLGLRTKHAAHNGQPELPLPMIISKPTPVLIYKEHSNDVYKVGSEDQLSPGSVLQNPFSPTLTYQKGISGQKEVAARGPSAVEQVVEGNFRKQFSRSSVGRPLFER